MKLGWLNLVRIEAIIKTNAFKYFIVKSSFSKFEWSLSDPIDCPSSWE